MAPIPKGPPKEEAFESILKKKEPAKLYPDTTPQSLEKNLS